MGTRQARRKENARKGKVLGEEKVEEKEEREREEEDNDEEEDDDDEEEEEDSGRESDDHREAEPEAEEEGKEKEKEEEEEDEDEEKKVEGQGQNEKVETVWEKSCAETDICHRTFSKVDEQKKCPVKWGQKQGREVEGFRVELEATRKLEKGLEEVIQFSYWTHGL